MRKLADEELAAVAVILDEEKEEQRTNKRKWVHEAWRKREREGEMSECCFNILLSKLSIYLQKQNTEIFKNIVGKNIKFLIPATEE
ncbi:hypothetical protein QE152_g4217 [Popillia japonica]|uniref:Uncharacterized protein n=1 Tax=Popillia japonica TaxID=7064 RepID=A0AAW1N1N1_POPJA